MKHLSQLLMAKLGITALVWCAPALFLTPEILHTKLGFPPLGTAGVFLQLLGMAYAALIVVYVFGLIELRRGAYPHCTVWTGLVSNGGAFLVLALAAWRGDWRSWTGVAPLYMWGSLLATGLISVGLGALGPWR